MTLKSKAKSNGIKTSSAGVFVSNGRKYAAGLIWLTSDDDFNSNLANKRAKQLDADFYCIRSNIVGQHGFGFLAMGHRMGMAAAAAIAADSLVGEWHGMFAVDGKWWYVAVHADAIAPDGDRLFLSEEEAYNFYVAQCSSYKWPRSFAPVSWNIPNTVPEVPFEKLVEESLQLASLRPNNLNAAFGGSRSKNLGLFIGAMLLMLLFVVVGIPAMTSGKPEEKRSYRPQIASSRIIKPPPPEPTREATTKINYFSERIPRPSGVIVLCADAFSKIILPLPGWDIAGIGCDTRNERGARAEASWRKRTGSLELVKDFVKTFPADATVDFNGSDIITVRTKIEDLFKISLPLKVVTREEAIQALYDRLGNLGRLQIVDRVPPPPEEKKGSKAIAGLLEEEPAPQKPPYLEVTLITETPPNVLSSYFDVPGLKLQNVTWVVRSKAWTYKSEVLFDSPLLSGQGGLAPAAKKAPAKATETKGRKRG